MKSALKLYLIPMIAALIAGIFWAPSSLSFLIFPSFTLLIIWCGRASSRQISLTGIVLFYLILDAICLRWIWGMDFSARGWVIVILGFILLPILQMVPWLFGVITLKKWGQGAYYIALPFLIVLWEIVNSLSFMGFPWLSPGLSIGSSALAPEGVVVIGPFGMSLAIYFCAALAALAYETENKNVKWVSGVGVALILLVTFVPLHQKDRSKFDKKVLAAHTAKDPYDWQPDELYLRSRDVLEAVSIANQQKADLVIFPEGYLRDFGERAIYTNDFLLNPAIRDIRRACQENQVSVIVGAISKRMYEVSSAPTPTALKVKEGLYSDILNTILLIDDEGEIQYRAKSKLVPFMERAPFLERFGEIGQLKLNINSASRSYHGDEELDQFEWEGVNLLPLICYESFDLNIFNRKCWSEARFLVNVSNEAWTQSSSMWKQHESYDELLAKFLGVSIARSVNAPEVHKSENSISTNFGYLRIVEI